MHVFSYSENAQFIGKLNEKSFNYKKNYSCMNLSNLPPKIGPTDIDLRVSFPDWPINKVGDRTTIVDIVSITISLQIDYHLFH